MSDVEMAHDEVQMFRAHCDLNADITQVYAGAISESVPSSITSFVNRHSRADSITSFTYFQEEDESPEYPSDQAVIDESDDETDHSEQADNDLESGSVLPRRRKSSAFSRTSVEDPLLHSHDSNQIHNSYYGQGLRTNQKINIETEGLLIVVAGFETRLVGFAAYITLCTATFGLFYLLFRWIPRLRVWLTGSPKPLRECAWVVVEVSLLSG